MVKILSDEISNSEKKTAKYTLLTEQMFMTDEHYRRTQLYLWRYPLFRPINKEIWLHILITTMKSWIIKEKLIWILKNHPVVQEPRDCYLWQGGEQESQIKKKDFNLSLSTATLHPASLAPAESLTIRQVGPGS